MTAIPALSTRDFRGARETGAARTALWSGRILTGLTSVLLLMDGIMKLFAPPEVVERTVRLGYSEASILPIGIVLLLCTVLYLIPRTTTLGAVLLTGYLGGAVATHVRVGSDWFSLFFPVFFGCLVWGGLWLRNESVRHAFTTR